MIKFEMFVYNLNFDKTCLEMWELIVFFPEPTKSVHEKHCFHFGARHPPGETYLLFEAVLPYFKQTKAGQHGQRKAESLVDVTRAS